MTSAKPLITLTSSNPNAAGQKLQRWIADGAESGYVDAKTGELRWMKGVRFGSSGTGNVGFYGVAAVAQQAGIINADGTLADLTTKFNALVQKLENYGLLAIV